jgi:hypothetical protein
MNFENLKKLKKARFLIKILFEKNFKIPDKTIVNKSMASEL